MWWVKGFDLAVCYSNSKDTVELVEYEVYICFSLIITGREFGWFKIMSVFSFEDGNRKGKSRINFWIKIKYKRCEFHVKKI